MFGWRLIDDVIILRLFLIVSCWGKTQRFVSILLGNVNNIWETLWRNCTSWACNGFISNNWTVSCQYNHQLSTEYIQTFPFRFCFFFSPFQLFFQLVYPISNKQPPFSVANSIVFGQLCVCSFVKTVLLRTVFEGNCLLLFFPPVFQRKGLSSLAIFFF